MRGRWAPGAVALIVAIAVGSVVAMAPGAASTQATGVKAFMTLYGYADNSPPGTVIAHRCIHASAGGTGTYANPITFATDVSELGWCTRIYVPYMKRYFIHEDECSECDRDWSTQHRYRFDMWAGGDARSLKQPERRALRHCESAWTRGDSIDDPRNPSVIVNPASTLPVTPAPIFSPPTSCWNGTSILVVNPGKQSTAVGSTVTLGMSARDYAVSQTLLYSARGLPPGLSIDRATGVISGRPTTHGRDSSVVTVADSSNAAQVGFSWQVAR